MEESVLLRKLDKSTGWRERHLVLSPDPCTGSGKGRYKKQGRYGAAIRKVVGSLSRDR